MEHKLEWQASHERHQHQQHQHEIGSQNNLCIKQSEKENGRLRESVCVFEAEDRWVWPWKQRKYGSLASVAQGRAPPNGWFP